MRFGRVPRSLPPNFPEVHTRWRRKQLTLPLPGGVPLDDDDNDSADR